MTYDEMRAILPVIILGAFCGVASYFGEYLKSEIKPAKSPVSRVRRAVASAFSSSAIAFIIFAILDSSSLTYMTKLAISCGVAFFGFDRAIEIAERLLNLRKG